MTKVCLFVTARTSSSRLPRKALLTIQDQKVIEHVLDRAASVRSVSRVILCTSTNSDDDELASIGKAKGVAVYRGSLDDKFQRWLGAAREHRADYFVEYDADDVFCDPELIELAVQQITAAPCDLLDLPSGTVIGGGAVSVSVEALRRAAVGAPPNVDDVWLHIRRTGTPVVRELSIVDPVFFTAGIRLTLDYEEDLMFFRAVFQEFGMSRNTVPLRTIVSFLKTRPDLTAINWFRQADYLENRRARNDIR
jgi:spore coat polysaccharide biosynthesis protein SpsF